MPGTLAPFRGQTFLLALLLSDANLPFPLTKLVSSPIPVTTYSKDLDMRLTACYAVAELLIKEHRAYHREFINANRPNPRVYAVDDIVFARQAVRSDAWRECVNTLQYTFTGPWKVTSVLPGASYELEHCENAGPKTRNMPPNYHRIHQN
jgi:hypothetical protein